MLVGIIDYGAGNLYSVSGALEFLKTPYTLVTRSVHLKSCTHIILPGVGSFRRAMESLGKLDLVMPIQEYTGGLKLPLLGICLGMQLLCSSSDEDGFTEGLNLVKGHFSKFDPSIRKVPHIGFDSVYFETGSKLFSTISNKLDFYFVHSYRLVEYEDSALYAFSDHEGERFVSAFEKGNIIGTQFHPELSQGNGLKILSNFLNLI